MATAGTGTPAGAGGTTRVGALDAARGVAIILVATFHMTRALSSAHRIGQVGWLQALDLLAYGFHVQIFFLLSGYFLYGRLGGWSGWARRSANLYYPYLIYSFVTGLMLLLSQGRANHEIAPADLALIPVLPIQHFWFIPFLILAMALLGLVRTRVELAWAALVGAAMMLSLLVPAIGGGAYDPMKLTYWLSFFLAGAVLRKRGWAPRVTAGWFVVALAISLGTLAFSMRTGVYTRDPRLIGCSLAMCYALYCVASRIAVPALTAIGALSLPIYLTHVIFGAGARIAVYAAWPRAPAPLAFAIMLAAAIAGPLVLAAIAERLGLSRALGFAPLLRDPPRAPAPAPA